MNINGVASYIADFVNGQTNLDINAATQNYSDYVNQLSSSSPQAGTFRLYSKNTGFYYKDAAGVEHSLAGGGGSSTNQISATEIVVNPSVGNDSTGTRGSSDAPFKTLAAAYNASQNYDVIICHAGNLGSAPFIIGSKAVDIKIAYAASSKEQYAHVENVSFNFTLANPSVGIRISGIYFKGLVSFNGGNISGSMRFNECSFDTITYTSSTNGGNYYLNCFFNGAVTIANVYVIFSECSSSSAFYIVQNSGTIDVKNWISTFGYVLHNQGALLLNDISGFLSDIDGNCIKSNVTTGLANNSAIVITNCSLFDGLNPRSIKIIGSVSILLAFYNTRVLFTSLQIQGPVSFENNSPSFSLCPTVSAMKNFLKIQNAPSNIPIGEISLYATQSGNDHLFTKNNAGVIKEIAYKDDITTSLQGAYDNGNIIDVVTDNPVIIKGAGILLSTLDQTTDSSFYLDGEGVIQSTKHSISSVNTPEFNIIYKPLNGTKLNNVLYRQSIRGLSDQSNVFKEVYTNDIKAATDFNSSLNAFGCEFKQTFLGNLNKKQELIFQPNNITQIKTSKLLIDKNDTDVALQIGVNNPFTILNQGGINTIQADNTCHLKSINGAVYIQYQSTGSTIIEGQDIKFNPQTAVFIENGKHFLPLTTNVSNLGAATLKFNSVFCSSIINSGGEVSFPNGLNVGQQNIPVNLGIFSQTVDLNVNTNGSQAILGSGVGSRRLYQPYKIGDSYSFKIGGRLSMTNKDKLRFQLMMGAGATIPVFETPDIEIEGDATIKYWELTLNFTIRSLGTSGLARIAINGDFEYINNLGSVEGASVFGQTTNNLDLTVVNTIGLNVNMMSQAMSMTSEVAVITKTF